MNTRVTLRVALRRGALFLALVAATVRVAGPSMAAEDDPYRGLEDIDSAASLQWVEAQNAVSMRELTGDPAYASTDARLLAIFDSKDRIPAVAKVGRWYYNFWQDADHVRGVMRRTTLDQYRNDAPTWETVIDVDALAATDRENWVWKGWDCRYPDYERCLVSLSRGGGDAVVVREFDLPTRRFVGADEGGFFLPESKSTINWIDADHVFVGTNFGPGSLTDSGYPRLVRRWTRATPLAAAAEVYAAAPTDVAAIGFRDRVHVEGKTVFRNLVVRQTSFFTNETFVVDTVDGRDRLTKIDKPDDADVVLWCDQILITLRKAWAPGTHGLGDRGIASGALVATNFERYLRGSRDFTELFTPGPRRALGAMALTANHVIVNAMSEVQNHGVEWSSTSAGWSSRPLELPLDGTVRIAPIDPDASDDWFLTLSSALEPTTLAFVDGATGRREPLKRLPSFFDAAGMTVVHREARSADGTRVPYEIAMPKGFVADGRAPTILYGYGGFEIAELPRAYSAAVGAAWLARGGVFVVAGIRGGGEFGADWHEAALKANRQRAFDDFEAVAQDLAATRITSADHLGILGGSNGGLLVGAVAMQRPELFKAVVCQVPLLDMRRYSKLLAGASWVGEYGDPDVPDEWAYIAKYSPYQNVFADRRYPRIFFETSTRDDRVHPGHARKMAAKMLDQKHDVLYWENTEGGHGAATNNAQRARLFALAYTFFMRELR